MNDPFSPGLLSRLTESPRKIVLLRASRIGDFLCATPSYRALRKALPDAEITMITLPMLQDLVSKGCERHRLGHGETPLLNYPPVPSPRKG